MTKPEPTAEDLTHRDRFGHPLCEICDAPLHDFEYKKPGDKCDRCEYHADDRDPVTPQEYHQSRLQAIAKEVEEELKAYDITDSMDKSQIYDALEASNPQEVGEIKQLIWFYHLITKHLE